MSAAPWVAAYAAALIGWLIVLAVRRQPTLWKGRALVYLNGAIIGILLVVILVRQQRPGAGLYILGAFLLASAVALRNVWLLLHIERGQIDHVLERCFRQTRASHQITPTGYTVGAGGGEMSVAITPLLAGYTVRFGGTSSSKKAQLIRALIAKQFQPSFPAVRIRA